MSTKGAGKTAMDAAVEEEKGYTVEEKEANAKPAETQTAVRAAKSGRTKKEEKKTAEKKSEQAENKTAKRAPRKTSTKKAEKPELKPEVYIEYQGQQAPEVSVIDKVKKAYAANGHRVSSIKSLQIYIKPEEYKAYYVINDGKYIGEVFIF